MEDGILIIALGSHLYGELAFNLAMSLKANDPKCKIALLYTDSSLKSLKDWHYNFFDKLIKVDVKDYLQEDRFQYQKVKTMMYKYSPFKRTLYIDADSIWIPGRKVTDLLEELKGKDLVICDCGKYSVTKRKPIREGYVYWSTPEQIIKRYNLKHGFIHQYQTSALYFEKTKEVKGFFEMCQRVYEDDKAPVTCWANGKPDEFCFNVASALTGIYTKILKWLPSYIEFVDRKSSQEYIYENYWILTITGHKASIRTQKIYNELVNRYCVNMNVIDRFYCKNKKDVIQERTAG